jgi:hypothetical protein
MHAVHYALLLALMATVVTAQPGPVNWGFSSPSPFSCLFSRTSINFTEPRIRQDMEAMKKACGEPCAAYIHAWIAFNAICSIPACESLSIPCHKAIRPLSQTQLSCICLWVCPCTWHRALRRVDRLIQLKTNTVWLFHATGTNTTTPACCPGSLPDAQTQASKATVPAKSACAPHIVLCRTCFHPRLTG